MDQKQIQIVLAVAKNLSFSEAAYETSYAASVISKQVASLENELGIRIFERKARSKVMLTEIGQRILPHIAAMQSEYEQIKEKIGTLSSHNSIKLICPRGFSGLGEDELISIFCAENPDIGVSQQEGGITECQSLLLNGEVDIAVRMFTKEQLESEDFGSQNLVFRHFSENGVGIILKQEHPAICDGKLELSGLRDETFYFQAFQENTQEDPKVEIFRNACRSEGFEPHVHIQRMRPWAAYALAAKGICVIPSMHAPAALFPGTCYVPLSKSYYTFTVGLLYRKDNPSKAIKKFVKCAYDNRAIFAAKAAF